VEGKLDKIVLFLATLNSTTLMVDVIEWLIDDSNNFAVIQRHRSTKYQRMKDLMNPAANRTSTLAERRVGDVPRYTLW
jgi:hypothetical protein